MMAKAKILLIDDHRTVLRLLEAILKLRGFELLYAESGRQGPPRARVDEVVVMWLDGPAETGGFAIRY